MTLHLDNISFEKGGTQILRGVKAVFPQHGVVGLIGANGSGKSTLLDIISGFRVPTTGSLYFDSQSLSRSMCLNLCCRLHQPVVVPESIPVSEYLATASDQTSPLFGLFHRKQLEKASSVTASAISLLHLAGVHDLSVHVRSLSWGQKRAVAMCAVLGTEKQVLLLDEPLSGISAEVREAASSWIKVICKDKLVVVVEHDLDLIGEISDWIIVMQSGSASMPYQGPLQPRQLTDLVNSHVTDEFNDD